MLVSIIIPSAGRRTELLQRAIKSALVDDEKIQTEIIVVLNGEDGMVFDTNASIQHRSVKYYKLEQSNVCKARNYGLSRAKGDLIRFLDDDDYLYSDVAYQQYLEFSNRDVDLSIYAVAIEDAEKRYQVVNPKDINDYVAATLSEGFSGLPLMTVYKSAIIKELQWDENCHVVEDEKWMRTVAVNNEIKWIRSNQVVAVWYQHDIDRLSKSAAFINSEIFINRKNSIVETIERLRFEGRLTSLRKDFASQGLWSAIHGGFYLNPIYWTKVAFYTRTLVSDSKPNDPLFKKIPNWINPIIIEWLMLPKRLLNHFFRILKYKMGYSSFIRKF